MSTTLIGIILVSVVLCVSAAVLAVELRRRRVFDWKKLKTGGSYLLPVGYTGRDLDTCVQAAVRCLKKHTNFPGMLYDATLPRVSVVVMSTDKWQQPLGGQWVGGETERVGAAYVVKVGRDVSALCHELAHVMEYAASGEADYQHLAWTDKNVWAADEEYRAWLKEATP